MGADEKFNFFLHGQKVLKVRFGTLSIRWTLAVCLLVAGIFAGGPEASAQKFTNSRGMVLFNNARYDSAVVEIQKWIGAHPEEEDIARYYLGECFYNLGMKENRRGRSQEYFRRAFREFDKVARFPALKDRYPKIYYGALLKKGWCYFRRAESGEQPLTMLDNAFKNFSAFDSDAPDSLVWHARFMAGESRLLEGRLRRFQALFLNMDQGQAGRILSVFQDARKNFDRVLQKAVPRTKLRLYAQIARSTVSYELGKFYQNLPEGIFPALVDPNKKETASKTALFYLDRARFSDLVPQVPQDSKQAYEGALHYFEAMKLLNRYFITFNLEDKQRFLSELKLAEGATPKAEILFRKGNADHNTLQLENNEAFSNLYQNNNSSYYFQSLPQNGREGIDEGYFWLGSVQYVVSRPEGIQNLTAYIQRHMTEIDDPRIMALLEYGRYWRGMLFLENYRNRRQRLVELRNFLAGFHPVNPQLENRKELLFNLTQLELGEEIWNQVLKGPENPNWLDEAIKIIRYLLRRAANYTGVQRLHYLDMINGFFTYTSHQGSNQTLFYQGIERSLRAEIQGDDEAKVRLFLESADILKQVQPPYKDEADYIRARSLFFAGRYDEAKKIFVRLINEKRSLRSLFYFGEILRLKGYGDAAKQCFEVVKQKTMNKPEGKFWYLNAEASIALCINKADGSKELSGVNIQGVVFPEHLLKDPSSSYERLADRKFVLYQYLQESLEVLRKYGLPKLALYPSMNVLANSRWKDRIFPGLPGLFDEMLRRETSVLEINVLAEQKKQGFQVELNGKPVQEVKAGVFESPRLNVGDHVVLTISSPAYYLFKTEFNVSKPGRQIIWAALSPRVLFQPANVTQPEIQVLDFTSRLDREFILQSGDFRIPESSALAKDLQQNIYLRDVAFHRQLRLFLVTDARYQRGLRQYSVSGEKLEGAEFFKLNFHGYDFGRFLSPEGIAVDFDGNIYVTDFAAHRVVVFDSTGQFKYFFGGYGRNTPEEIGQKAHFVFPTRIAIEEDLEGIPVQQRGEQARVFRNSYLLIADRYGIHRCDLEGHFLETVLESQASGLEPGEYYALGIQGYGTKARLFIADRKKKELRAFEARPVR